MRVDKFLKVSRIIKRRALAAQACDAGKVSVNGKVSKPSVTVKEGDVIELTLGDKTRKFEVLTLKESTRKEDSITMYKVVDHV
ncbi:MAG: RNA-binding S4 domain-containing protein [Defluviitaleaceae bacterium]|nr:RNA-binding S4 domain-containing protein [Defluviitaleaceae bacterium]